MKAETERIFRIFVEQTERIRAYHFEDHVKKVGLGFQGKGREDGSWEWEFSLPDEKERDAFLLVFRMFIQQNDEIGILNLNRFHNDPGVSIEWKEGYSEARDVYLKKILHTYPAMVDNTFFEGYPSNEKIMDTVIYGWLAHVPKDHPEKRELFLRWARNDISKYILFQSFTRVLLAVLQVIYRISWLCEKELDSANKVN